MRRTGGMEEGWLVGNRKGTRDKVSCRAPARRERRGCFAREAAGPGWGRGAEALARCLQPVAGCSGCG